MIFFISNNKNGKIGLYSVIIIRFFFTEKNI
jgi:hypothetical protein